MLSYVEKSKLNKYLENPETAKQISFSIQREEILKKHPNAFFAEQNQSLFEYIYYILHNLPFGLIKSRYVEECLMYLYEQENPYLVSCTKELYPEIAKKHPGKNENGVERSIRHFIGKEFPNIREHIKNEYFSVPEGFIPTNSYFIFDLIEYVKTHYFYDDGIFLTKEQQDYFLENLKQKDNAMNIIETAEKKKEIQKFLYEKLGHFKYCANVSAYILIDLIMFYMEHPFDTKECIYDNVELYEKWDFYDYNSFTYKMNSISFAIDKAFPNVDLETYKQIFGDIERHRGLLQYISQVCNYLKEQEYQRSLTM